MKKLASIGFIAVAVAILVIGCATTDKSVINDKVVTIQESGSAESSNDEQDIKALSETLMTEFLAGDFSNLRLTMSDELKAIATEAYLNQVWTGMTFSQSIKEVESITLAKQDNYEVVTVTVPLSTVKLNGIFTYDENSVLAGLYFMLAPLTPKIVSTADFEEIAIKVGADGFELDGRLTLPKNAEKPPVVIIISGSEEQNMDGILAVPIMRCIGI